MYLLVNTHTYAHTKTKQTQAHAHVRDKTKNEDVLIYKASTSKSALDRSSAKMSTVQRSADI